MNTRPEEVNVATEPETGTSQGGDPLESYIDDLIHALLKEAEPGAATATHYKDPTAAVMIEAVVSSLSRPVSQVSMLEKVLLAEALASAVAQALAPTLAEALAPEIMKALEHIGSSKGRSKGRDESAASSSSGRTASRPSAAST
jgi:hypothetical protein